MIFFGTTMFPIDLLILRPSPSSTKPWLSTPLYGALPVTATAVDNEELNQPRYWSDPSKYKSAGRCKSSRSSNTAW
ncbi:Uncharacterised protein [Streptococcus pneumoniae]|nr:Uncharacterised protein [Streptococcus pneumoniae]COR25326.1 Uncharacterised protein [Streptococcus pneumoniae]CRG00525.1 Uncharacterised protein [Streptococcus pneumoniae]